MSKSTEAIMGASVFLLLLLAMPLLGKAQGAQAPPVEFRDVQTIQRLVNEFRAELATLGPRVTAAEEAANEARQIAETAGTRVAAAEEVANEAKQIAETVWDGMTLTLFGILIGIVIGVGLDVGLRKGIGLGFLAAAAATLIVLILVAFGDKQIVLFMKQLLAY